jgi:hypothetical protein
MKKDVNLRVGDRYEMKERQPDHETDDGILEYYIDFVY